LAIGNPIGQLAIGTPISRKWDPDNATHHGVPRVASWTNEGRRSLRHPSIRFFVSPPVWRTRAPQHAAMFPPYDECPSESSQDVSEARKATSCGIPCWTTCLPLHRTSDDAFQASAHDVHRVWLYSEIALRPSLSENAFFSKNLGTRNQFAVQINFVRV